MRIKQEDFEDKFVRKSIDVLINHFVFNDTIYFNDYFDRLLPIIHADGGATNDVSRVIVFIEQFLFEEGLILILRNEEEQKKNPKSRDLTYWQLTQKGKSFFLHQSLDKYIADRVKEQEKEELQEKININQFKFNKILTVTTVLSVIIALFSLVVSIKQCSKDEAKNSNCCEGRNNSEICDCQHSH